MKKRFFFIVVCYSFGSCLFSQNTLNSTDLLRKMYARYQGAWHPTLTFDQTTERYRNDSLIKSTEWHEYIEYPDKMRIDMGDPAQGDAIIYNRDSLFQFRGGKLFRAGRGENELLFFLGGMYFLPFERVIAHYRELGYDLSKSGTAEWAGRKVFIIGGTSDADVSNQVWVDANEFFVVRFIKYESGRKTEGIFEKQIRLRKAWSETKARFYDNGKLTQMELYRNVVAGSILPYTLFEPGEFGKWQ